MTRASVTTARRGAGRVAGVLLGGFLVAILAGCSSNGPAQEPVPTASLAPAAQTPTKPVTFAPVIGAPAKVSTKINELLVAQATQKGVPVVPPKDAEYTIRGYLVAAADPKGAKLSYIWDVSDKTNKRKRIQGEEVIEGKKGADAWSSVDDAVMQRVATKAVEEIVAYLPKGAPVPVASAPERPNEASAPAAASAGCSITSCNPLASLFGSPPPLQPVQTASPASSESDSPAPAASAPVKVASLNNDDASAAIAQPASSSSAPSQRASAGSGAVLAAQTSEPAPVKLAAARPANDAVAVVPAVTGAPGDGGQSLTAAMRKALQSAGVKLSDSSSGANIYTVRGSVEMGAAADGQQPITIQWTVVDPSGKPLSQAVVQRNKVGQGSLDGPWGQIADIAAGEAAKSIAKLLVKPTG